MAYRLEFVHNFVEKRGTAESAEAQAALAEAQSYVEPTPHIHSTVVEQPSEPEEEWEDLEEPAAPAQAEQDEWEDVKTSNSVAVFAAGNNGNNSETGKINFYSRRYIQIPCRHRLAY